MIDELRSKLAIYLNDWQIVVDERSNADFFNALRPTAVGWKCTDRDELMLYVTALRDLCDQIHFGWINERLVVSLHLKDEKLPGNVTIIKLMERRPGSEDPVGLDHVDFYTTAPVKANIQLEEDLDWNEEKNGEHCKWISVWFEGGEAKLRTDTVLKVCAAEMLEYEARILKEHQ